VFPPCYETVIQLTKQCADGDIQLFEREELAMAQRRHNPVMSGNLICLNSGQLIGAEVSWR
jgi:hypothetical protein